MIYILTLNWNGADKLKRLAPTLLPAIEELDWEWWVKDNASKDESIAYLQSLNNPRIKVIQYKDNRQNFSEGVNSLFQQANPKNGAHIMLLNNDVMFRETSDVYSMLNILDQDPKVGVVGCRLLYTGSNVIQHAGVVFNPTYMTPMHFKAGQISDLDSEKNREFQAVTGAVLITRAELFRQVCTENPSGINGLDEKLVWSFDDTCMCLAIKYNLGKKIVYCGKTNIWHDESATLKKNPVNKMFLPHNLSRLFDKWQGKYTLDQDIYFRNPNHNLYRVS